ncbi:hypothetical protein [Streptomyces similanensis]|uniref:Uncharacterized protein n=1 Tax=Streptomyces similanensis TaxID=1274988 RepID=A0ABP9L8F7_9ACTN
MVSSFRLDEQETNRRFAAYFKGLEDRISALERPNQLSNASIEGGSLDIYDDEGTLKGSIGMQPDGGVALVPVNTDPPPRPTPPLVEPKLAGLTVGWDGAWEDAAEAPSDFGLVQVHAGTTEAFEPSVITQVGTITAPLGGTVTVGTEGYSSVWVRLVAANTAAVTGEPSTAVEGKPRQAVGADLIDGIVTEVKLAQDAVTEAKIALGAVGTTALADGAVLEEKLAKAAVTLGKIASGAVTLNTLGGTLSDSAAQRLIDSMADPASWTVTEKGTGAAWSLVSGVTDAQTGQTVGRAQGYIRLQGTTPTAYEPGTLYRISARVRLTGPAGRSETFYVGAVGFGADGKTLVNRNGVQGTGNQHYYVAASAKSITTADGWVTVVGFLQDRAPAGVAGSAGPNNDPRSPGVVHQDTRYIAPYVWLNYNGLGTTSTSVMEVDTVTVEAVKTGQVDVINLNAGSVTAFALAAGSVTAAAVAAGSITADKLTIVGSPNVLPDPSFEGAAGAAVAAKQTWLSIDKAFGNGSPASLKLDATSAAAADRAADLTVVPMLPADQVYIATDYYPSATWTGAGINLHVQWEKADGTVLSSSTISDPAIVKGAWGRLSGTVTAPASTAQARIRVQSAGGTAGSVWWDNAAVRPVVPGVQIADGAITTPKLFAGAVTTDKLVALSVTAEKVAALAITTDKLAALAVTADKLAVNSVTATAIAAGSIDSTHIKAGSIAADRLALGTDGNVIADPSFEGAISDARVAADTNWAIVSPGNGTARALKVSTVSGTPTNRVLILATLPAQPGQKVWLTFDYLASTDWAGSSLGLYGQWFDAAGTLLGYSSVTVAGAAAARGAWSTLSAVPDQAAPRGAVQLRIVCGVVGGTAGTVQFDNTACRIVLASGVAGARAEVSPQGLQLYDESGQEAVALVTGRPQYLTLRTAGVPVATIDQNGNAGFQQVAANTLSVGGTDVQQLLDMQPRGILAIDYQTSSRTSSGAEVGFVELGCTLDETRMYRFVFCARVNPSAAGGELRVYLRGGIPATPALTSTQRYLHVYPFGSGNSGTVRLEHISSGKVFGSGMRRFLVSFMCATGPSGQTCQLYGANDYPGYFYIEDIGPYIPETGGYSDGGGSGGTITRWTKMYPCTWSGTYQNRGSLTSSLGVQCYQGGSALAASMVGFSPSLASDLAGATMLKAELYLFYDSWQANTGGTAVIRAHRQTNQPAAFSADTASVTAPFARNEGKLVDITPIFDPATTRGVALDPNSVLDAYSGRARGQGQTNAPLLRISYTK